MQRCKLIVLSNPAEGIEAEPRDSFIRANVHNVLKVPGVVGAQFFQLIKRQCDSAQQAWDYMALYDCETDDIDQIIAELKAGTESPPSAGARDKTHFISYLEPISQSKHKAVQDRIETCELRNATNGKVKATLARPATTIGASDPALSKEWRTEIGSMRVEDWAGPVAGPTYIEEHFEIARSTLHRWQQRNQVIALRKGDRRHVYPLAQFVDGRPVPGISDVLALAMHPRLAWFWLVRPSPDLGGRVPIELLRQDMVTEVVLAARRGCAAAEQTTPSPV